TANKSRYFVWTEDHDVLMLREAVTSEPYNFKPKSSERGKVWESIATYLNSLKTPEFRVTARAVRDRYALLTSRHKLKQREEEKASGIDVPELTELDALLEEIREREKSAEEKSDALRNERKAKDEKEKAKAEEIRQAAPQTMAIRKNDDSGEKPKKAKLRRSTSDAIGFLAEKSEKERELKKEELAIRKRELDRAETRQEGAVRQQQQLQQQNLQIMLDQQNKVFMALMENIKKH
ncbi:unnamed protein product, partial [Porites lobata]